MSAKMSEFIKMDNQINVLHPLHRSLDERANDKGAISRFLSDTSANASGSIVYLYKRMNARRCKIRFLGNTLWVGENRKIGKGRLQLNLASLSIHGSAKCPIKSHQTLTMTVQSVMTAGWDHDFRSISVNYSFTARYRRQITLIFAKDTSLDPSIMFWD